MGKTNGFGDYIRAAFTARPGGMFIPPNWIGLVVFGLLGAKVDPGFFVVGAGLELGYLFALATNGRFQRLVNGASALKEQAEAMKKIGGRVRSLSPDSQRRFEFLRVKCDAVLSTYAAQGGTGEALLATHAESLNRFVYIFLQLLLTREGVLNLAREGKLSREAQGKLETQVRDIERQLAQGNLTPELARSLEGKRDILLQRIENLSEGERKLQYVESELSRVEQQVELLRERAALARDSDAITAQIDSVGASLGETADWIKTQKSLFDVTQDLTEEAPPLLARARQREG